MILVIPWLSLLLAGIGSYLLAWTGLDILTDLGSGLIKYFHRQLKPRVMFRLIEYREEIGEPSSTQDDLFTPKRLFALALESRPVWIVSGMCLAFIIHDVMLSPLLALLVPLMAEFYRTHVHRLRRRRMDEDASNLVMQVESRYPLNRSLVRTLTEALATLPEGRVRQVLAICVHKLEMNAEIAAAFEPLKRLGHPSLDRLAGALAHAQDTRQEIFLDTLRLLREEVESHMDLRRRARRSLTVVFITTRVLQVVLVIAFLIVSLLPAWRTYYTGIPKNWIIMVVALTVAALGSVYVETEMRQLEG